MDFGFYSFSEPLNQGIDFYTGDESDVSIQIDVTSNLQIAITKIAFSSVTIANTSDLQVIARRIIFASANIVCDGATLTLGTRVKLAQCSITASSNLSIAAQKIAFASSSISGDANISASANKIATSSSSINITSNALISAIKISKAASTINLTSNLSVFSTLIKLAKASLSGNVNLTVAGDIFLITAKIVIFNNTNITAQTIRFSNSITADTTLIRTLLMLDGIPLTNQNRQFDVAVSPIYVENINWQGDTSRYYKNTNSNSGAKRTFNLQWRFIPNYETKTVDLRASRNFIRKKSKDGDVHTLTILKQDENGITPYTEENVDVLITNYSENLIRRDLIDDVYYFDCSMSLEEV